MNILSIMRVYKPRYNAYIYNAFIVILLFPVWALMFVVKSMYFITAVAHHYNSYNTLFQGGGVKKHLRPPLVQTRNSPFYQGRI